MSEVTFANSPRTGWDVESFADRVTEGWYMRWRFFTRRLHSLYEWGHLSCCNTWSEAASEVLYVTSGQSGNLRLNSNTEMQQMLDIVTMWSSCEKVKALESSSNQIFISFLLVFTVLCHMLETRKPVIPVRCQGLWLGRWISIEKLQTLSFRKIKTVFSMFYKILQSQF